MRDLLKRIFSKPEPESIVLEYNSIPGLLDSKENAAREAFTTASAAPIKNIRSSALQLRQIVNSISDSEQDPAIHPKLKSIAKNTLPQFIRSMNVALAKEPPEDPEEFYLAAVECVKGCLNSIRGPGRYLQIVFPDEMKAARKTVDDMGHEINLLTSAIASFRKESEKIIRAREIFDAIETAQADLKKATEKDKRMEVRIREYSERLAAIGQEKTALISDPGMADAKEKETALLGLETQRDETARRYASYSMTASHVLRKAEKIAARQKHPHEVSVLQQAMHLLSDHELPEAGELEKALSAAFPVASRMIDTGEITLKNKEERAVFSDTMQFSAEVSSTCRRLVSEEESCNTARETLVNHPALVRMKSLEKEFAQLESMLKKEQAGRQDLADWQQKTEESIPLLTEELREKTEEIMGKNVQFSDKSEGPA